MSTCNFKSDLSNCFVFFGGGGERLRYSLSEPWSSYSHHCPETAALTSTADKLLSTCNAFVYESQQAVGGGGKL